MARRGRTSTAERELMYLAPQGVRSSGEPRLSPRSDSPEHIALLFREIVASVPDDHWRPADSHLIEQYAQACLLARQAYERLHIDGAVNDQGKANGWLVVLEKAHRSSVALSARLRLAPQSRLDAKTVGRADPHRGRKRPWE